MTGGLIGLAIIALLGVGLRLVMSRGAENRLAPAEQIDIAALRPPLPENGFLACPANYCTVATASPSPVFALPWERLHAAWEQVVASEPRTIRVVADPERRHFVYIQHSALLRFPDIITVEFVALGSDRSSLAIYSRARYGKSDFGVNRKRVEAWLARLSEIARQSG